MVPTAWKRSTKPRDAASALGESKDGAAAKIQCCADAEHHEEGVDNAGIWSVRRNHHVLGQPVRLDQWAEPVKINVYEVYGLIDARQPAEYT